MGKIHQRCIDCSFLQKMSLFYIRKVKKQKQNINNALSEKLYAYTSDSQKRLCRLIYYLSQDFDYIYFVRILCFCLTILENIFYVILFAQYYFDIITLEL